MKILTGGKRVCVGGGGGEKKKKDKPLKFSVSSEREGRD